MNFRELLENKEMAIEELVEIKEIKFRRKSPNGQFVLGSVAVPKKVADTLIKNTEHIRSGYYQFQVFETEVFVGYNLWTELKLNKYALLP